MKHKNRRIRKHIEEINIQEQENVSEELRQLAWHAQQADGWKDFKIIFHEGLLGQYWHVTQEENFDVDPSAAGTIQSGSVSFEYKGEGGFLFVASARDIIEWINNGYLDNREWAVEVSLYGLKKGQDYKIGRADPMRGYYGEILVDGDKVQIKRKTTKDTAFREAKKYMNQIVPTSDKELAEFYERATGDEVPEDSKWWE